MKNLTIKENQPAIYITNLGKYTEGKHVGQWLNVPATQDQFNQALKISVLMVYSMKSIFNRLGKYRRH